MERVDFVPKCEAEHDLSANAHYSVNLNCGVRTLAETGEDSLLSAKKNTALVRDMECPGFESGLHHGMRG
jgi:hypothetical protein